MDNEEDIDLLDEPDEQPDDEEQDDDAEAGESDDPLDGELELQQALLKLYQKCVSEDRYARLIEVRDVKKAENYWAGRQYDYWSEGEQCYKPITSPTGGASQGNYDPDDIPRFQFVTNIYQPTGLTVIGAVAGAPPRVRFFPDDPDSAHDLETAEGRTKLARLIQRWNPPQLLLQEETYNAWNGGFVCLETEYVPNGEKYGFTSVDLLSEGSEEVEQTILCPKCGWSAPANQAEPPIPCPQCGAELTEDDVTQEDPISVPQDGGSEDIPKGRQIIRAWGALNCKRPQHVNHQSEYHYFAIEREVHYSILRGAFEDKAGKIQPGLDFGEDDAFERMARLSISENSPGPSQSSGGSSSLITYANVWFRPTAFRMIDDETQRKKLLEMFPLGVKAYFAGTVYCKSKAQSMDAAIVTCHAMPGRGQHRPGIGTSLLSVQDRFNTFTNIETETYEYGIPVTYRASDTFDSEANEDQRAAPGLEVEVPLLPNTDIRQRIMQVRADSVSPDMAKHTMDLMGPVTQYLSGTFPALTGAAQDQPDTLGQQSMQRDQAMGRMGVFYVNLKQAHADILTIACRDFESHADGEVKIPIFGESGDFESDSVDVTALEGEATAYPEGDENFPELWNQQRATMMQVADSPFGAKLLEDTDNAELMGTMTGVPGLKIPGVDAKRKQLKEISELTKIPAENPLAGIAPHVEVDSDDYHQTEADVCQKWMNSEKGQKLKRDNPMGWLAVKQHRAQHLAQIPAPKAPEKPLTESLNVAFKDMPPEAQAQVLEKLGIHVKPEDFIAALALKQAEKTPKTPHPMSGEPQPGGQQLPPAAGAQ